MSKGQAALEYLLSYGWAILIVIIVGAALYSLGVFSPGTWTGKRTTGFAQFQVVDFKMDDGGNVTLILGNRVGKTVQLDSINLTLKGGTCSKSIGTSFGPNVQKNWTLQCGGSDGTNWPDLTVKSSYTITADLHYTDPDSGLTHIDSGNLFGAVEYP